MATANELAINTAATALDMANTMFGDGIQIVSATYSGDAMSSGVYSGATTTIAGIVPTDTGVILSTGNVGTFTNSSGTGNTNTAANSGTNTSGVDGNAQLNSIAGTNTFDGAIFDASFVPQGNYLTMQFVFSSEEYLEYVNKGFDDAVGVWVNGKFVPLTLAGGQRVSIDTVNNVQNANLYVNNPATTDPYNTEMDGFTRVLTFKAAVNPGQVNTIRIGIADAGDSAYDSNIMIMGDSIQTVTLAFEDKVTLDANASRTLDVLANDADLAGKGLTVTQINGQNIVAGQTITLPTGERVRLNPDGTITLFADGDIGSNTLTYTVTDAAGNTDVGFITVTTVAAGSQARDGIVEGTAGADLITAGFAGDPNGDRIDANDALGVGGTTGDGDYIKAFGGNDTVLSGAGADMIYAGSGDDSVDGGAGNDAIYGETGADTLAGALGADQMFGGDGNDQLFGGDDADTLSGGQGDDLLQGGAGNDALSGDAGADTLQGGDGRDALTAGGGDVVDGGEGGDDQDTLIANDVLSIAFDANNPENGTITFIDSSTLLFSNIEKLLINGGPDGVVDGTAGNDVIRTGYVDLQGDRVDGNDALLPGQTGNDDIIKAGNGDDTVQADFGRDVVYAGDGHDSVSGGTEDDTLYGGAGNDTLEGDANNDSLEGGQGEDKLYGGNGNDTLLGDDGNDTLFGIEGDDLLYGGAGNDDLIADQGADTLYGGAGNDTLRGDDGSDSLYGGDDADMLYSGSGYNASGGGFADGGEGGTDDDTLFATNVKGVVYDPLNDENGTVTFNDDSVLTFTNIEHLIINGGPDGEVEGTSGANLIDATFVDRNGDRVDANDARLPGKAPNDDNINGMAGNDTIFAGLGDDVVYAGEDDDLVDLGDGNDTAQGELGNDTLYGGAGNDSIWGDSGNDSVYGGEGNDSVYGGRGSDQVFGGEGNDFVYGGYDNDTVFGGAGNDFVLGSGETDLIYGGDGDDTLEGSNGNDTFFGGAGADEMRGEDDRDVFYAGAGDMVTGGSGGDDFDTLNVFDVNFVAYDPGNSEQGVVTFNDGTTMQFFDIEKVVIDGVEPPDGIVEGTAGDDLIDAGYGNDPQGDRIDNSDALLPEAGPQDDYVLAGDGNDKVLAGAGNDRVEGGAGADTLFGGAGNDTLQGGAGDDTLEGGDDRDTLFGGAGDVINGGSGGDDVDTLDLSQAGASSRTFTFDPQNHENGSVELFDADGLSMGVVTFTDIEQIVPCFTPGTLVLTDTGEVAVEEIAVGDRVLTRDNGFQVVRWIGRRDLSAADLIAAPHLNPIRIAAAALGNARPERDMLVSPQHRMLITGSRAEMFFGDYEVLVAATHLLGQQGVSQLALPGVSYIHLMFERHEIIHADGTWSESFQPGDHTLAGMDEAQRAEIFALFPDLAFGTAGFPAARRTLKRHEALLLA